MQSSVPLTARRAIQMMSDRGTWQDHGSISALLGLMCGGNVRLREAIEQTQLIQLRDLLSGLVPNSLPDDGEIGYVVQVQESDYVRIRCTLRNGPYPAAEAVLTLQVNDAGQVLRVHSLQGSRVYPEF